MTSWRLSEEADEDLVAIFIQGCDLFGPRQADLYVDEIWATFPKLAKHPEMARLRTEFEPPFRIFRFKAHLIFYDQDADGLLILRIRHGHEDWRSDTTAADDHKDQTS